jgi:hypothetical protein
VETGRRGKEKATQEGGNRKVTALCGGTWSFREGREVNNAD